MTPEIAIVASACRLPDAASPAALWANCVAGRRSFRAIPPARLDLLRYAREAIGEVDSITPIRAGLITDWQFDRQKFRIPKSTYESTDLVHWLALELANEVMQRIGGAEILDRRRTAVVVANTLTGEFSRTALLRMRAPFLADLLDRASRAVGVGDDVASELRGRFIAELQACLGPPTEDSLAGGLANTIAGRIANFFDLGGGAYTVDGACASSLLAVADAANLLVTEQADAVLVGAVDLSLDPFELVGFSRAGAFARDDMRVFDARAGGFWPGEGGAFVLLVRKDIADRRGLDVAAVLRGWGISSDGAGGLTRPSTDGQHLAYKRAYERADVSPGDLSFVEAHGTGTAIGDPTEVKALAALRAGSSAPLPIGSVKANIGHTKAAAGLAGLIKTLEALRHRMVAPHVGCIEPHPVFAEVDGAIKPALSAEALDDGRPLVAGVSSFGFGGINAHVVLEGKAARPATTIMVQQPAPFDAQLFLFAGADEADLEKQLGLVERRAAALSTTELAEAAATVSLRARHHRRRVAIVAADGEELMRAVREAKSLVANGQASQDPDSAVFVGHVACAPRVGFLFPGQAAPVRIGGGLWARCFPAVRSAAAKIDLAGNRKPTDTDVAQPAIVAASMSALDLLERARVTAVVGVGHSLGEIAGLAWAGALSRGEAIGLARARGAIMASKAAAGGAMARLEMPRQAVDRLLEGSGLVVACENGPAEFIVAGRPEDVAGLERRCAGSRTAFVRLPVSHAFHTTDMEPAARSLADHVEAIRFEALTGDLVSTVTGGKLGPDHDLVDILVRQLTVPVLFDAALAEAADRADIFIEVGPGHALTRLARAKGLVAYATDAHGASLKPTLRAIAALFAAGCDIDVSPFFVGHGASAFDFNRVPVMLANPCGSVGGMSPPPPKPAAPPVEPLPLPLAANEGAVEVVLSAVARESGLSADAIGLDDKFLDDLHLNSLAVTRLVVAAARALQARLPQAPTEFANATARQLAEALDEIRVLSPMTERGGGRVPGVRPWVRTYAMEWREAAVVAGPADLAGQHRIIDVPDPFDAGTARALLGSVQAAIRDGCRHLVIVHRDAPIAAFARSVFLEGHFSSMTVVDRADVEGSGEIVRRLAGGAAPGYSEYRLAGDGKVESPVFVAAAPTPGDTLRVGKTDVVLAVGGAKGIAAECTLRLGSRGASLILLGRSPADDPEVVKTLERSRDAGIRCSYVAADARDASTLAAALSESIAQLGAPTILLHAAGVNEPARVNKLDDASLDRALTPKVAALENILALVGRSLRRVITFGSLIGRIGLEGEAHYALANALQTRLVQLWGREHPGCATLAIEWSVWGGVGMGERLGTVERLEQIGVDSISVDDALDMFDRLVGGGATGAIVVTSRFGPPPHLDLANELSLTGRFCDDVRIFFPEVEAVVETALNRGKDRYLDDHVIDGEAVFPGVMAMEAMAQVAGLVAPRVKINVVGDIRFDRAITVPQGGSTRIRIAALRNDDGSVDSVLTSDADGFSMPYARARFSAASRSPQPWPSSNRTGAKVDAGLLYRHLLFQGPRFQRLSHWDLMTSRDVEARFAAPQATTWFGPFEKADLVLFDPGIADATLHVLQPAVPQRRVIPVRIDEIVVFGDAGVPVRVRARELRTEGNTYVFDILVEDAAGRAVQEWRSATFAAIDRIDCTPLLDEVSELAVPYLERLGRESLDDTLTVAIVNNRENSRETRRGQCADRLGLAAVPIRRPDGKPTGADNAGGISFAHRGAVTLAVAGGCNVGCDINESAAGAAFVVSEVGRKLGRRLAFRGSSSPRVGATLEEAGIRVLTTPLPTADGAFLVGLGAEAVPTAGRSRRSEVVTP